MSQSEEWNRMCEVNTKVNEFQLFGDSIHLACQEVNQTTLYYKVSNNNNNCGHFRRVNYDPRVVI